MTPDITAYLVILIDLFVSGFLIWRVSVKKATLWKSARAIYMYIAFLTLYHMTIYTISLFIPGYMEAEFVYKYLHPIVVLYVLNPGLIAIIHYRGGHLL